MTWCKCRSLSSYIVISDETEKNIVDTFIDLSTVFFFSGSQQKKGIERLKFNVGGIALITQLHQHSQMVTH
jgi:hypothetical protein